MLKHYLPLPVKFICGIIYVNEDIYSRAKKNLLRRFGKIDLESQKLPFDHTNYYEKEMGKPLFRRFISFKRLKKTTDFVSIKLSCIGIEKRFAVSEKRRVNIDPGYINEAKLVLSTTKDFAHRIHLNKGIFAEVTLCFNNGEFSDLKTTFPDYRTIEYKSIFTSIRNLYSKQLKKK